MLDELIPQIEKLQSQGAVVLIKWDGERAVNRGSVVVTRKDTDYLFHRDSDNIQSILREALADYTAEHQN